VLLFDYSGAVLLLGLFFYGLAKRAGVASWPDVLRHCGWYVLGTLGPVFLLWLYQWRSFGHAFYPGQHWMPPVEWIERGYQGYGWPQIELLLALAFDHRFGLFVSSPLMLLAILCPMVQRVRRRLPALELTTILFCFVALWVFLSGNNYTRLQFNTGIRYMAPALPFLFVPAAVLLVRLPLIVIYPFAVLLVTEAWCLAMIREVERDLGVLDPILRVFLGGFQLPVFTTLSRLSGQYGEFFQYGVSPFPLFALTGVILYGVWSPRFAGVQSSSVQSTLKMRKRRVAS